MRKTTKTLVSLLMAVVMIAALCVPAFAVSNGTIPEKPYSNSEFFHIGDYDLHYRQFKAKGAEKGKIFIAESPLFEITSGNDTYFAYNEFEKAEILKKLGNKKYTLQRSKGLGENEPEMMWQTTMNPETRRLIKVMPEDAERTAHYFDVLLGDALNERKNFIAENGAKYLELADIS